MSVLYSLDLQLDTKAILAAITCELRMSIVATDVLQLINSNDATVFKIADVITQDQPLTLRVLKLANSPFYGLSRSINTVKDAIVVLGEKALCNMVLAMAVKGMYKHQGDIERNMWEESAAIAMAARFIAAKVGGHHPDEAFMAGLMCNVGELLCNNDKPGEYTAIIAQSIKNIDGKRDAQEKFGYQFSQIGAALLNEWNFSPLMVASIFYADEAELNGDAEDENFLLCSIVYLARKVCQHLGFGSYTEQQEPFCAGYAGEVLEMTAIEIAALPEEFATEFAEKSAALMQF